MVVKVVGKALFGRFVEFTPVIIIFATNCRPDIVNAAGTTLLDMFATSADKQVPATVILVNFDILMGNLPQQMPEIRLGTRCVNGLCDIGTANSTGTATAFVIDE